MSLLWPATVKAEPSGVVRFGRVLHWAAVAIGVGPLAFGAWLVVAGYTDVDGPGTAALLLWCAFSALVGRGLRYIFSGE